MTWSDDAIATLKKLWLAGESASHIARRLGAEATRAAVIGKVHRLGLVRNPGVQGGLTTISKPVRVKPAPAAAAPPASDALSALRAADGRRPVDLSRAKPLLERGERECCWPVGAPDPKRGQLFCCAATEFRQSYCGDHSTSNGQALKAIRLKGEHRVQRARREHQECDIELTELVA